MPSSQGDRPRQAPDARQWWTHLWIPLLVFAAAIALITWQHIDWRLAHGLFAGQGEAWPLRKAVLTETLIHKRGHDLSILAWLVVLAFWLASFKRASLRANATRAACSGSVFCNTQTKCASSSPKAGTSVTVHSTEILLPSGRWHSRSPT